MTVATKWNDLFTEVENCCKCKIAETIHNKVFGEGPLSCEVMSVSEAPGAEEDETGRPYRGRAGKLWEEALASVEWTRHQLYVCNVLKCRPIQNKLAKDLHEVDNCRSYLLKQVNLVNPKLIVAFGKTAAHALGVISRDDYDKTRMADWVGKVHENTPIGVPVIITYHPSYLLRTPSKCLDVYYHLCSAKEFSEK